MSRRRRDPSPDYTRLQVMSMAVAFAMEDIEDDILILHRLKNPRLHDYWMQPHLHARTDHSQRNTLAKLESDFIRLGTPGQFKKTTRMPPGLYRELLDAVRPLIQRQDTPFRQSISPEERLSVSIRYLTRGDSVTTLSQAYLIGESSVLPVVRDTCKALYATLHKKYMKAPSTREEWMAVSQQYHDQWNLPHVLGAIDGKHIRITKPHKTGSLYYNYKNFYSIVLFAAVDADYRFMYVDVGAEGRSSDSSLWKYSDFHRDILAENNPLDLPAPEEFPGFSDRLPFYFVGDDAFELSENLMKPYPHSKLQLKERIFNYRLSRCRRIVENSFGILATRFRILRREIEMSPDNAAIVVLTCCVLHNFLREHAAGAYTPKEATDWEGKDYCQHKGIWRGEPALPGGRANKGKNTKQKIKDMRSALTNWCVSMEGQLVYQYEVVLTHEFFFER